jgi:hypothetical protein
MEKKENECRRFFFQTANFLFSFFQKAFNFHTFFPSIILKAKKKVFIDTIYINVAFGFGGKKV